VLLLLLLLLLLLATCVNEAEELAELVNVPVSAIVEELSVGYVTPVLLLVLSTPLSLEEEDDMDDCAAELEESSLEVTNPAVLLLLLLAMLLSMVLVTLELSSPELEKEPVVVEAVDPSYFAALDDDEIPVLLLLLDTPAYAVLVVAPHMTTETTSTTRSARNML
jgi:hypothetical protein